MLVLTKEQKKQRTALRKKCWTENEVKKYVRTHPDLEYPFMREVWLDAVDRAKINANDNKKNDKSIQSGNGKLFKKRKEENPSTLYFQLMALKQNEEKGEESRYAEKYPEDDEFIKNHSTDEVIEWIDLFPPAERHYLIKRYQSYMDTYEINKGADMTTFKRLLSLEIEAYRIDVNRALNKGVDIGDEERVNRMLQATLESLKWTKKQRSAREEKAKNKFSVYMDTLVKEGDFKVKKKKYPQDQIDKLLDIMCESMEAMLE